MEPENGSYGKNVGIERFVLIQPHKIESILKVLDERLPRSGRVYNCALRLSRHPGEFPIYTLHGNLSSTAWIVVVAQTLDYGQFISISPPTNAEITESTRLAFIETDIFCWDKPFIFSGLDRSISSMIMEISVQVFGSATLCAPNICYYMEKDDALKIHVEPIRDENLTLKPLDTKDGATFLASNWKYRKEGTLQNVQSRIEKGLSCGVYVDGKPVCGIMTHPDCLLGMLYTEPNHRRKGYAVMCMKSILKNMAENGFVPSSNAEEKNKAANGFHLKAGMKVSHICDYIFYMGSTW